MKFIYREYLHAGVQFNFIKGFIGLLQHEIHFQRMNFPVIDFTIGGFPRKLLNAKFIVTNGYQYVTNHFSGKEEKSISGGTPLAMR